MRLESLVFLVVGGRPMPDEFLVIVVDAALVLGVVVVEFLEALVGLVEVSESLVVMLLVGVG